MTHDALCPDPGRYVPQKPPMVALTRVVSVTDDEVVCEADTSPDGPLGALLRRTGGSGALLMEMMAQAIGVWAGYQRERSGREAIGIGFLMSARALRLRAARVPAGQRLLVRMRKVLYEGNLGSFEGSVSSGETVLASGRVSVCEPDAQQLKEIFGERP